MDRKRQLTHTWASAIALGCLVLRGPGRRRARRRRERVRRAAPGAAAGLRAGAATSAQPQELENIERTRAQVEEALGPEAFAAAFESGAAEPERVVREALGSSASTLIG